MRKFTVMAITFAMLMVSTMSYVMAEEAVPADSAGDIHQTVEQETDDAEKGEKAKQNKIKEEKLDKANSVKDDVDDEEDKDVEKVEKRKISKELLEKIKAERKQAKLEMAAFINGVKELFKDADVETRKEILAEIAAAKKELKDYSIGAFIKGIAVDFDKYDGVRPVIENNRTLAPLRAIIEAYGADVEWENETRTITISKDAMKITLQIDSKTAYVNDKEVQLDVAPKIINNRTLVPIRFISEAFKLNVEWDQESQTIIID